ncbi:uncharacterized protein LOC113664759 [Pocillopora damicornis]|nr:uncharacterized protein LOC113664759 [Pocillopora damicornis]
MALVPNGLLYFILMTSWISRSLMSPVAKQHTAAFDEIARVNQNYAKYQEGSEWQVDMKLPRRNVGRKGVDGSAPIRDRSNLWPKGIIPYTIAYSIPGNSKIRQLLKDAMAEYEKLTCIKFVERENQVDYVEFYYGEGCNSDVGRIGGRQTTSLGRGCAHHGIVVHELGHLVGFWHEQNRPDRDNYIEIKEENIIPKFKYAFHKYSSRRIDSLGVEYDYKSVMHYGAKAFSKNGLPTIVARQRSIKTFGNTNLSILDIQQVNLLYRCPDYPKFPQDFVWSSNGQMRKNATYSIYARCIRITHHRSASWRDNYMCYRKDKKSLSLSFSTRGPVPGKKCLQIRTPTKSYYEIWDRSYLCWPHDGIYKFKWLTHAPTAEERANCLEWSEPRDPTWGRNRYFLCATKDRKPIDGNWTRWTPWTTCTRKCGGGVQSRLRSCTNPQPSSGGQYCVGKASDTRMCNTQECAEWPKFPEDFSFGRKPRAGPNETCVRIFERLDYFTFKDYLLCSAADKRQPEMRWSDQGEVNNRECTRILVPEDSQGTKRGRWDNNYLCISTDGGFPYRFVWSYSNRIAGLPCMRWYAKNGRDGWDKTYLCAEDRFKSPVTPVVIINGGWSSWTSWNTCSKSCGSGKQHRVRQCDNPKPSRNGRTCQGKALDERLCNEQKCPSACGHEFQAVSGRFNSPNYPKPYPGKMNCEWVIRVPDGQRIEFKFLFFNVYGSYPLCDDSVSVYDGQTVSSRRIGKFCGSKLPTVLRSSSNVMLVKFHSNVQRGYYGFNAKWEAKKVEVKETANECGRQLTESTGTLTSPGYPGSYPPNADCIWVITAPRGHYIELKFKIFDIHKVGRGCRYDYVEVRDGNSRNSPSLGRHCGQSVDEKFQTISNHARIRLHSDGSRERKGFVLTWRSLRKPVVTQEPTTKPLCPRGWVSHLMNGTDMVYCYLVRHNTHTWYMARNDCIRSRSDLLSISNAKEQEFVTKHLLAESFMWIGYNDIQREGQWAWSDRTHQSYKNWATGDPNNGGRSRKKDEDCAVLKSDGKWNDYPCTTRFKYICKARASRLSVEGLHSRRRDPR